MSELKCPKCGSTDVIKFGRVREVGAIMPLLCTEPSLSTSSLTRRFAGNLPVSELRTFLLKILPSDGLFVL